MERRRIIAFIQYVVICIVTQILQTTDVEINHYYIAQHIS